MTYDDFASFIALRQNHVYRVDTLKRVFTPYEQEEKFSDESPWEYQGDYVFTSAVVLPDKDILIGMRCYDECADEDARLSMTEDFYKLSEIRFFDITEVIIEE